ncbi:MAG: hypothetical protein K0R92_3434 [Lachnospiraceae bacterium]|jgi:hypothetical protein|nr:hypothetical protein [Lachnospiraceae bacterium]
MDIRKEDIKGILDEVIMVGFYLLFLFMIAVILMR